MALDEAVAGRDIDPWVHNFAATLERLSDSWWRLLHLP